MPTIYARNDAITFTGTDPVRVVEKSSGRSLLFFENRGASQITIAYAPRGPPVFGNGIVLAPGPIVGGVQQPGASWSDTREGKLDGEVWAISSLPVGTLAVVED